MLSHFARSCLGGKDKIFLEIIVLVLISILCVTIVMYFVFDAWNLQLGRWCFSVTLPYLWPDIKMVQGSRDWIPDINSTQLIHIWISICQHTQKKRYSRVIWLPGIKVKQRDKGTFLASSPAKCMRQRIAVVPALQQLQWAALKISQDF